MANFLRLTFLTLLLLLSSCDSSVTASKDLLHGTWQADFNKSWGISKEAFMKDTMRGAGGYPKDPAQREAAIRKETEDLLQSMRLTFAADGTATMAAMGRDVKGTFEVTGTEKNQLTIKVNVGMEMEYTIEFAGKDQINMTNKGSVPTTIVLNRTAPKP